MAYRRRQVSGLPSKRILDYKEDFVSRIEGEDEAYACLLAHVLQLRKGQDSGHENGKKSPYRGDRLDFAFYRVYIEDAEEKLDTALGSSNHIANLIAVCSVQSNYLIAADFPKVHCHLCSAFAGLVGVIRRVGHSGAETWTT